MTAYLPIRGESKTGGGANLRIMVQRKAKGAGE
jgi:hypothetical protein